MSMSGLIDHCSAYVKSLGQHTDKGRPPAGRPSITLSRQFGARGVTIGRALLKQLTHSSKENHPWALFDQNLMRQVAQTLQWPPQWGQYLEEDSPDRLQTAISEILGFHPPLEALQEQASAQLRRLLQQGGVILVGRGGCIIGADLPNVLHVRLIGSAERRQAHLVAQRGYAPETVADEVRATDQRRKHYFERTYGVNGDNPSLYHLTLNTDRLSDDQAASIITQALKQVCGA